MQEQNQTIDAFISRTDEIAKSLDIPKRDIGPALGISTATYFALKAGKRPISTRTWRKVERAEASLALKQSPDDQISERLKEGPAGAALLMDDDDLLDAIRNMVSHAAEESHSLKRAGYLEIVIALSRELHRRLISAASPARIRTQSQTQS